MSSKLSSFKTASGSSTDPLEFCICLFDWLSYGSDGEDSACNRGDLSCISGSERSQGEGNGYPFHYSCMKTPWTEEPGRP